MPGLLELGNGDTSGYDPWEAAAAAVRRRYPTRPTDPLTQAASNITWSQWLGDPRAQATNVYYGENFDPSATFKAALGTVGAPAVGPAQAGAVLGAGAIRRAPAAIDQALLQRILQQTAEQGGSSTQILTGAPPSSGLMMGIYRNADPRNLVLPQGQAPSLLDLQNFTQRNINALQAPNRYLGTWQDPASGQTYFDVSQRFDPAALRAATKFGERSGQISGYNVGPGQTFPVGNWWEFIGGPEYRQRLRDMAGVGREFLAQHPSKEWWDLHGTSLELVYGPENLPAVAGYTSTTAPRTKVAENLREMTEYMRRELAGEPIVQPGWRMGEGGLWLSPGSQMPMETSRIANLQRVRRGALGELSSTKVADEARAFLGDPNVGPIDVHHIRLGEAPERGIYAASQPGEIETEATKAMGVAPYDYQQAQIADEARNFGRTLRDYSADVWTGITETIRRTNQLYGTPFKGSAIGGGKGYADQFSDMLASAAKQLGMKQDKLENELRRGNTSLLSHVLVTSPAAAAAYQQWRGGQSATPSND